MVQREDYSNTKSLVIENARVIDGLGKVQRDLQALYIEQGEIKGIGRDMGVHNFVHSGFMFEQPARAFLNRMQKQGTYVTTTLSCTFDQMLVNLELERLDDAYLKQTVPEALLNTARNPEVWKAYYDTFFRISSPNWQAGGFTHRA